MADRFDIAVAGGGLAGSLIALALAKRRPDLSVALVEAGPSLGGNHVWSFFASDVDPENGAWVDPLVVARWDHGYDVRFPEYARTLPTPYRSVTSERLAEVVGATLHDGAVRVGCAVAAIDANGIDLADGGRIAATGVIDARGLTPELLRCFDGGWQKFAGAMLRTAAPHGLTRPVVMDAGVDQIDGYRFVYCLPFSDHEVFVEDTYYSDTPDLDPTALFARIDAYAARHGWAVAEISRRETGVLPVVTDGDIDELWDAAAPGVALAGVRAGLFQPLTSYSFPDAVRLAAHIAALPRLDSASLASASRDYAQAHWRRGGFYRLLARMLFGAANPVDRYKVLQRFYRLDAALVERFYAGKSSSADKLRVLAGKPPVPLMRAAKVLAGFGAPPRLSPDGPEGLK